MVIKVTACNLRRQTRADVHPSKGPGFKDSFKKEEVSKGANTADESEEIISQSVSDRMRCCYDAVHYFYLV